MNDVFSLTQILGYIASIALLTAYAISCDKKTKIILVVSAIFFAVHFFMLGAFTAVAISILNALRNVSSIIFHGSKPILVVFISLYLLSGFYTYQTLIDILPLSAAIITCLGMFLLNGLRFRILVVVACMLWLIHNIHVGSIGGTINPIILIIISLVTVTRMHKKRDVNVI